MTVFAYSAIQEIAGLHAATASFAKKQLAFKQQQEGLILHETENDEDSFTEPARLIPPSNHRGSRAEDYEEKGCCLTSVVFPTAHAATTVVRGTNGRGWARLALNKPLCRCILIVIESNAHHHIDMNHLLIHMPLGALCICTANQDPHSILDHKAVS